MNKFDIYKSVLLDKIIFFVSLFFITIILCFAIMFFNIKNKNLDLNLEDLKNAINEKNSYIQNVEKVTKNLEFYKNKNIDVYEYPIRNFDFNGYLDLIQKRFSSFEDISNFKSKIIKIDKDFIEEMFVQLTKEQKDAIKYKTAISFNADEELSSHYFVDLLITSLPGSLNIEKFQINVDESLMLNIIKYSMFNKKFVYSKIKDKIQTNIEFSLSIVNHQNKI
jgi:hypothetical protein